MQSSLLQIASPKPFAVNQVTFVSIFGCKGYYYKARSEFGWTRSPNYAIQRRHFIKPQGKFCKFGSCPRSLWRGLRAKAASSMTSPTVETCISLLRKAAPALDGVSYKGQAGKIAVVGGSLEYTGAPYFAAISSMRGGAELAFVHCAESAAPAIKVYSPDLIVYPGFKSLGEECESLDRMQAIVLGPGLGRGKEAYVVVDKVIRYASGKGKPLVIDADALWFVSQSEGLRRIIRDAPRGCKVFMTPNKVEMDRLQAALRVSESEPFMRWFRGNVVLVQKGQFDTVVGENFIVEVSNSGSLKRVGGQGDVLAGLLALCSSWMTNIAVSAHPKDTELHAVAAAVCACLLTRSAAHRAFLNHGRSLLASDILPYIGSAVDEVLAEASE